MQAFIPAFSQVSILLLCDSHSFSHWFHTSQEHRSHWYQHSPPRILLPVLQQWPCASWVRTCILLKTCFSSIQIIKIKISTGSILRFYLSVYVFICLSNMPGLTGLNNPMRRSLPLFRAGLTCAGTNWGAALEAEQRQGVSERSWNTVWSQQITIKECCPLM